MLFRFNPRSRAGSDICFKQLIFRMAGLQSTLPRGERPRGLEHLVAVERASIHAPARGATRYSHALLHYNGCFNPRSRAGSDSTWRRSSRRCPASIHAPARGATTRRATAGNEERLQSTLPRGERLPGVNPCHTLPGLQSTLPRGERPFDCGPSVVVSGASIHAPARGATLWASSPSS